MPKAPRRKQLPENRSETMLVGEVVGPEGGVGGGFAAVPEVA